MLPCSVTQTANTDYTHLVTPKISTKYNIVAIVLIVNTFHRNSDYKTVIILNMGTA